MSRPTPFPPISILLSVSVVTNASQFFSFNPRPLSSTMAETASFLRSVCTVTITRPFSATSSPYRDCVEWMALLIASKSGCNASATFAGFGRRAMRLTRFGRRDVTKHHKLDLAERRRVIRL